MAKKGAKVTGIDISEEQLKFAKRLAEKNRVKIKFIQRDIRKLQPGKFKIFKCVNQGIRRRINTRRDIW